MFENDVKMYGTQAVCVIRAMTYGFENDVKMYGTQALLDKNNYTRTFENDVKMYGTQASSSYRERRPGLRMM